MKGLDNFYLTQEEPAKSTFMALRQLILALDKDITPEWKYNLPFFYHKGKMFCYLWKDKKTNEPYIGVVDGLLIEHPLLEQGDRKRMKILRVNPNKDIAVVVIQEILNASLALRKN